MKKIYVAAATYTGLGLLSGLFYREYTKAADFTGYSQLNTLHTHFFALGTLMFLVVLGLAAIFNLDRIKGFNAFFWTYNAGLVVTTLLMLIHGIIQVGGNNNEIPAIAGIAGLGHILLTIGLVMLLVVLGKGVKEFESKRQ